MPDLISRVPKSLGDLAHWKGTLLQYYESAYSIRARVRVVTLHFLRTTVLVVIVGIILHAHAFYKWNGGACNMPSKTYITVGLQITSILSISHCLHRFRNENLDSFLWPPSTLREFCPSHT